MILSMPDQPAQHPVFISYARKANLKHAVALHERLGADLAFLDSEDIALGEQFPPALVDALFGARVVVIFAEPVYFTRWYCLLEFRIARTPFLRAVERHGSTPQEREEALRGIVIAMPAGSADPMLDRFPALVQARNWPNVADPDKIADLVLAELAANPPTLRERYEALGDADSARRSLLEATKLPPPMRIGAIPFVPQVGLPTTIGDSFVGRADDLWRIHDVLWTERGDPVTAAGLAGAIEAGGGFGKTRLALEYLYRFGPRYFPGGVFWINAEQDAELQLYDVLQAINPQIPELAVLRDTPSGVPGVLARTLRNRTDVPPPLFIIDNVPDPESAQPPQPLETWCPVLGEVPVLTTSRTRVSLVGGNVLALPIQTLDPDAAVRLLTSGTPREQLIEAEWSKIADWVGHLPLALELLNAMLRSRAMTPRAMLEMSRDQRPSEALDSGMKAIRGSVPEGKLRGIAETFAASYGRLQSHAQNAARLLAWLAPAPVPESIMEEFGQEIFPPDVRSLLLTRSIVTEVRDDSAAYYGSLHRVLADYLRGQSQDPLGEAEQVRTFLRRAFEFRSKHIQADLNRIRIAAPVAITFVEHFSRTRDGSKQIAHAIDFATEIGKYLVRWQLADQAAVLFSIAYTKSSQEYGEEHDNTVTALKHLSGMLSTPSIHTGTEQLRNRLAEVNLQVVDTGGTENLKVIRDIAKFLSAQSVVLGSRPQPGS